MTAMRTGLIRGTAFAALMLASTNASAETRGYAIANFMTATYANPGNCPQGGNGTAAEIKVKILMQERGYTKEQAIKVMGNGDKDDKGERIDVTRRGQIDGKPVDIANFPFATKDPQIELNVGKLGPGFDLDGKEGPDSFTDPDTGEKGIDNQMLRALGCFATYDIRPPTPPYPESISWDTQMEAMAAWLMSVTGDDLDKDGPVTITFDRALNTLTRNAHGKAAADVSFIVDPNPQSHSVFKGKVENGVLSITEPGDFFMQAEPPFHTLIQMSHAHLRMNLKPDGSLTGFLGGYEKWAYYYAWLNIRGEGTSLVNLPGVYYAMKRLAEVEPDAKGQNTAISNAYWFEVVPAFHTTVDGKLTASAKRTLGRPAPQSVATGY